MHKFTDEQLVAIRDAAYRDVNKLYQANTLPKGSGKWSYCVLHSDGKGLGSFSVKNPPCHAVLNHLVVDYRSTSKCLKEGLTVPVAILQRIPDLDFFQRLGGEKGREQWVDFCINKSPFRHMFLDHDVQRVLQNGFLVRTDRHPDWVLRTCSFLRKAEEHRVGIFAWYNCKGIVPEDVAFILGYNCQEGSELVGYTNGHSCFGRMYYTDGTVKDIVPRYIQYHIEQTQIEPKPSAWYMSTLEQVHGWTERFGEDFRKTLPKELKVGLGFKNPLKFIPESKGTFQDCQRAEISNVHTVVQNIYKECFQDE